jgi:translocation and assembly module TamB
MAEDSLRIWLGRLTRWLGVTLAVLLAVVAAVAVALFLALRTDAGRERLLAFVESVASTPERQIALDGLDLDGIGDIYLARVALADPDGVWLEGDQLALRWRPAALLRGRLEVERLSLERLHVARAPEGPASEPSDEPFSLPQLPESLPPVAIQAFAIDRLELAPPVLGTAAVFTVQGALDVAEAGDDATARLTLDRLDGPGTRLSLDASADLAGRTLGLALDGAVGTDLASVLTGQPDAGPFTLSLRGDGPLAGWQGRLDLDAPPFAQLGGDLQLAASGTPGLGGRFTLQPGPALVPPDLPEAAAPAQIALDLALPDATTLGLRRLVVEHPLADVEVAGTVGLGQPGALDLNGRLVVSELAPLGRLGGQEIAGGLRADLAASGSFAEPALRVDATASGLRVPQLPSISDLTLSLAATRAADGTVTLSRLAAEGFGATVSGQGSLVPAPLALDAEVALTVADLATLLPEAQGRLQANLSATTPEPGRTAYEVDATADGLALTERPLPDRLTERIRLTATGSYAADGSLEVDALRLDAGPAALSASGRYAPGGAVSGRVDGSVDDLAALSDPAGQPLAGRLQFSGTVEGTVDALQAKMEAALADGAVSGFRIDEGRLTATAAGPAAQPEGSLHLEATRGGQPISLATDYRLESDRLELTRLALDVPDGGLEGDLTTRFTGPSLDGRLDGRIGDLARLSAWHGLDLRGAAELSVVLDLAPKAGQTARAQIKLADLDGLTGPIRSAQVDATARHLLSTPSFEARARVEGVGAGTVEGATATVSGTLDALDWTVEARGGLPPAYDLSGRGAVARADGQTTVTVRALSGQVGPAPVELRAPLRLAVAGETVRVDGLDLALLRGRLTGSGAYGPAQIDARLRADGIDLATLEDFGAPGLAGRLGAELTAGGTAAAPTATLSARVTGLAPADAGSMALAPGDLTLNARLADQRLSADARLSGITSEPVTASLALPIRFALQPFAFAPGTELQVRLQANIDLQEIQRILALDGQTLRGRLAIDYRIAGRLDAPELRGAATLSAASYENREWGTRLRGVEARLVGAGRSLVLENLSGTDGAAGRLSGSGRVSLEPARDFAHEVSLRLTRMQVLGTDLYTATVSGPLSLTGTNAAGRLTGDVTVERADIFVANTGGASVPTIQVEEIAADGQVVRADTGGAPYALTLDVRVRAANQIFVRAAVFESEWRADLRIGGEATAPRITGSVNLVRGQADVLAQRFTFRDSQINFTGATPPDPQLELTAAGRSRDGVTALIQVTGLASKPEISLTSEPPLPEDEVLSRILFGRSSDSLSGPQALRLALALDDLRGGGRTFDVFGRVRDTIGLDQFGAGETDDGAPTLQAGKYLSDNVFVSVERGATPESGQARVEVEILPNVSLQGEVNQTAAGNVGLKWSYDY